MSNARLTTLVRSALFGGIRTGPTKTPSSTVGKPDWQSKRHKNWPKLMAERQTHQKLQKVQNPRLQQGKRTSQEAPLSSSKMSTRPKAERSQAKLTETPEAEAEPQATKTFGNTRRSTEARVTTEIPEVGHTGIAQQQVIGDCTAKPNRRQRHITLSAATANHSRGDIRQQSRAVGTHTCIANNTLRTKLPSVAPLTPRRSTAPLTREQGRIGMCTTQIETPGNYINTRKLMFLNQFLQQLLQMKQSFSNCNAKTNSYTGHWTRQMSKGAGPAAVDPTPGTGPAAVDPKPGTGPAAVDPKPGTGPAAADPPPGTGPLTGTQGRLLTETGHLAENPRLTP